MHYVKHIADNMEIRINCIQESALSNGNGQGKWTHIFTSDPCTICNMLWEPKQFSKGELEK